MLHSFETKADPTAIHELITQASAVLKKLDIHDDGTLTLAIHEAVINAYEACLKKNLKGKAIRVTIEKSDNTVTVTVLDPAGNLDPRTIDSSEKRLNEANLSLHESGRGLYFIQSIMDEVQVQSVLDSALFKQQLIMKKEV